MDGGDWWRGTDQRQWIVKKIMETLKRCKPCYGLQELNRIAVRFEEKIYSTATSHSEYVREISSKLLSAEAKCHIIPKPNPLQSNAASNSTNPQDQVVSDSQGSPIALQSFSGTSKEKVSSPHKESTKKRKAPEPKSKAPEAVPTTNVDSPPRPSGMGSKSLRSPKKSIGEISAHCEQVRELKEEPKQVPEELGDTMFHSEA